MQKLSGILKLCLPCDSSSVLKNNNLSVFEKQVKTSSKMHYYGMTHGNEKHESGSTTKKENEPSTSQASRNVRGACLNLSGAGVSSGNGGSSGDGDDEDNSNQKKIPQDAPDLILDVEENSAGEKSSTTEITDMLANFSLDEKPPSKPYCSPMDVSPAVAATSIVQNRTDNREFDCAFSEEKQFFSPECYHNVYAAALPQDEQEQVGTIMVQSDTHMSVDDDNDQMDDDDNASYFSDTTSESQVAL